MAKKYSKTKTELVKIVQDLIAEHGDTYKFPITSVHQNAQVRMGAGVLPVNASHLFFQRIPRDYDNPEGLQRALKQAKISSIEELVKQKPRYTSPNAVVANLLVNNREEVVQLKPDQQSPKITWIEVNLQALLEKLQAAEKDEDDYLLDESKVMLGFLIDAHHRTEGFYSAGKMTFELPLTLYIDLPLKEMSDVFLAINQFQEKPSSTHTLAMRALSNNLAGKDEQAHSVLTILNEDDGSILFKRIKVFDGPVPKGEPKPYINSSTFHTLLPKFILNVLPDKMGIADKTTILNHYFSAWKVVFPSAWMDQTNHVLVKSMGFQIMMRLFETIVVKARNSFNTAAPSIDQFAQVIRTYFGPVENGGRREDQQITVSEDADTPVQIPINWDSKHFGAYSNGKGVNLLSDVLKQHTINQDHQDMEP